jgi:hypothetical protein
MTTQRQVLKDGHGAAEQAQWKAARKAAKKMRVTAKPKTKRQAQAHPEMLVGRCPRPMCRAFGLRLVGRSFSEGFGFRREVWSCPQGHHHTMRVHPQPK